jgi:hypothetical protein
MREIDSDFLHRCLHFRVNSWTRLCPSRNGLGLFSIGELIEKSSCHL